MQNLAGQLTELYNIGLIFLNAVWIVICSLMLGSALLGTFFAAKRASCNRGFGIFGRL